MRSILALLTIVAASVASSAAASTPAPVAVWPGFGYDAAGSDQGPDVTGITRENLSSLVPTVVSLPGVVDSSPVYVRGLALGGRLHDVYVVDTTYGRTLAVDAATGRILWQFAPPRIASFEGSLAITTSSPVVDPDLRWVYSASPDGYVHKLDLATGEEAGGRWPVRVTVDPTQEKISSALEVYGRDVLVALAGLSEKIGVGDQRVGHLVAIDRDTGRIAHVFNSLCDDREVVIRASSCVDHQAGIWARLPAPVDPAGNLLVAIGDGPWNGRTSWGDSVVELASDFHLLQSYTPQAEGNLQVDDLDLGSTSPAILTSRYAVQSGKDGLLRLLDLGALGGGGRVSAGARARLGGELATIATPGSAEVLTRPAVWHRPGRQPWVFVANDYGISGYSFAPLPKPHLVLMWNDGRPGSSPVIAGGLLYAYNVDEGGLSIYDPSPAFGTREPNEPLLTLSIPRGHWNSPVVADGRIALGDGDANQHQTTGSLYIWSLSGTTR